MYANVLLQFNDGMKIFLIMFLACFGPAAVADNAYAVEAAIYKIQVVDSSSGKGQAGTGVLVAQDKILTNCHILEGVSGWPRVRHRKTGDWYKITRYYRLGDLDACVLVGGFVGRPVSFSNQISIGENVWIFGYPAGLPVVGQGTVKGFADGGKTLQLVAFCAHGSSGGPVVNARGELLGLNYAVYTNYNHCLSIPVSSLRPYF